MRSCLIRVWSAFLVCQLILQNLVFTEFVQQEKVESPKTPFSRKDERKKSMFVKGKKMMDIAGDGASKYIASFGKHIELTYKQLADIMKSFTEEEYSVETENHDLKVDSKFVLKFTYDEKHISLMNFLTQYKLPKIHTVSFENCGSILESVRHILNNSLPYSISDLYLICNNFDNEESKKEGDEEEDQREFVHTIPSNKFIEDLCEVIAYSMKVTSKLVIRGLSLSVAQFCSLLTAADNISNLEINDNIVAREGWFELPYNNFMHLRQLDLSNNSLSSAHLNNIVNFLTHNSEILKEMVKINLSGNISLRSMRNFDYISILISKAKSLDQFCILHVE